MNSSARTIAGAALSGTRSMPITGTEHSLMSLESSASILSRMAEHSRWPISIMMAVWKYFLKNRNGPQLRLLKNAVENLPPSIAFHLRGGKSNRDAIGAAVTVETEVSRQTRFLQAGSGFLSQHSKEVFFGLGDAKGSVWASIRWPSGLVQPLHDLPINHRIWVDEGLEPSRMEAFKVARREAHSASLASQSATGQLDPLPSVVETW